MQISRSMVAAVLAVCVAALIGAFAADGAPARDVEAERFEYDVRMIEHGFLPADKDVDLERQLLNKMAAASWQLVDVSTYPPAEVPAGVGRTVKDRLTRYFYFRRPVR
jgi:hypothetical protein